MGGTSGEDSLLLPETRRTSKSRLSVADATYRPAPSFHVYADQMFPRLDVSLFYKKDRGVDTMGGGGGGVISRRNSIGYQASSASVSRRSSLGGGGGGGGGGGSGGVGGGRARGDTEQGEEIGRMDLMSSLDPSDSGYDDDESEESTKRTPMKKRRVSMKAMTALRFSTTGGRLTGMTLTGGDFIGTGEQQQEQQQQQQQGEEGHMLNDGRKRRVLSGRGGRMLGRAGTPLRRSNADERGAADGGGSGMSVKNSKKKAAILESQRTTSLFNDLTRLVETVGKEDRKLSSKKMDMFEKEDVRRRLVDELFAIRVGETPHKYNNNRR